MFLVKYLVFLGNIHAILILWVFMREYLSKIVSKIYLLFTKRISVLTTSVLFLPILPSDRASSFSNSFLRLFMMQNQGRKLGKQKGMRLLSKGCKMLGRTAIVYQGN